MLQEITRPSTKPKKKNQNNFPKQSFSFVYYCFVQFIYYLRNADIKKIELKPPI